MITGVSVGTTDVTITFSTGLTVTPSVTILQQGKELEAVLYNIATIIKTYSEFTGSVYPNQLANLLSTGSATSTSYSTLDELFTDIANKTRQLSGGSDLIPVKELYKEILKLL